MTAETPQVHCQLSEVAMEEENSGLSSHQDHLPNVGGDCNGINNNNNNCNKKNVGGKDDPDGSYVFVSRSESANGDLIDRDLEADGVNKSHVVSESIDVAGQVGKLKHDNGEVAPAESNCVGEGTDVVLPPVGKQQPTVAGVVDVGQQVQFPIDIVESVCEEGLINGDARLDKEIEPDSACDLEQNQKFLAEVDRSGTPLLNDGKIESKEQINLSSGAESGAVVECQVLVSEEDKPVKQIAIENSEQAQAAFSEPSECNSSLLNEGKLNSEDHAIVELPGELQGSQESQVMVSEAAECELPGVEVQLDEENFNLNSTAELGEESQMFVSELGDLNHGEEKPEKQSTPTTADFRESEDAQIVDSEPSECKSSSNDETILKSEESAYIELYTQVEGSDESQVIVSEAAECKSLDVDITEVIAEVESAELESHHLDNGDVKLDEEEKADLTSDVKENQESELLVHDCLNSGSEEVNEIAKLANETVPLEAEVADEHVLHLSNGSCPSPHVYGGMTQDQVCNELIDGCQNTTEFNGSANIKSLPDPADCQRSEFETGNLCCPAEEAKVEIEFKHDTDEGEISTSFNKVSSGTESVLSANPEGNISTSRGAEVNSESEVSNGVIDCASIQPIAVNSLDSEYHGIDELQNGYGANMKSESHIETCPPVSIQDMPSSDRDVSQSEVVDISVVNSGSEPSCVREAWGVQEDGDQVNGGDGDTFDVLKCQKVDASDGNIADALKEKSSDALNEQAGVEGLKRPFNFLIKVPRFDDENLREQIRHAHLQVNEKTHQRDAIRDDIHMITGSRQQLRDGCEAARSEERGARGLLNLKRKEIDSVQYVINRVKNAISVEDMNVRINNMERMIQHETLPLKEEKHLIRQINQLKHLRDQLSSNMGSQDEVQQALDQRDQNEEKLKILKKELDCLKAKVSKTQATALAADKKWNEESKKLNELHVQFRAADRVRQEAYMHLQNLKGQLYDKNAQFRKYKNDTTVAYEYASNQDKEGLHRLCVNQVEKIMDLWNKDDEFRKEYLRCNTRSTLRRFRTSDGRALGPDEEPIALPNFVDDRSLPTPYNETSELPISTLEQEKQGSTMAGEGTYSKSTVKVVEQIDQTANAKKPGKPTLRTGVETVSGRDKAEEMSEVEPKKSKEEQELARKEEELRKEAAAAKLKEQQRQEEKAKAKEALERKRRNAEKAQIKAELRAQKEAEQKEKEREKKAKKKERKKAAASEGSDGNNEGETVLTSESPFFTAKEAETEESLVTITKRPQKASQFTKQSKTKSIPPPLRNRGKRRMQQWIWIIFTVVVVLALFLLGNIGFYSNLGHNLRMRN
ncbi:hypothetical protein RHMOL_Rhmol07G0323600 [Rhododendron molle]|uniref:Uncharacterized protein n=1 Tax=Rhododendron molle TaxID=49168 RepID=A0ACC0N7C1_RHOML|nr:hypothetical protein RHMOL_Rhmol07G0323600 [Rhododendron molle]